MARSERATAKKGASASRRPKTSSRTVRRTRTGKFVETGARSTAKSPPTRATVLLEDALDNAGIRASAVDFLGMVREAVESLRAVPAPDPREQLSASDVAVLERGGFDLSRSRPGEAMPVESTVAAYVAMMDDALSVAEAAKRLRVDQSRVRQLLAGGSLLGVKLRGEWRLPSFQFTRRGTVTGIQEVLRVLPKDLHPVEILRWLQNPDPDLEIGGRAVAPLDWLRSGGDPERASVVARDL